MSDFDSFAADTMSFLRDCQGETITVTPKGGQPTQVTAVVLRSPLRTRPHDNNRRLEYEQEILIRIVDYPGGKPNMNADTAAVKVRKEDTTPSTKKISHLISQEGGMYRLGLS
jgi:hypothetical protein